MQTFYFSFPFREATTRNPRRVGPGRLGSKQNPGGPQENFDRIIIEGILPIFLAKSETVFLADSEVIFINL